MKIGVLSIKYILPIGLALALFSIAMAQANEPVLILSWSADTNVPSGYEGKTLPVLDSTITASADLIERDKFLDLSSAEFIWSVDGDAYGIRLGAQTFSFPVRQARGANHWVRLEMTLRGQAYEQDLFIPISSPQLVIAAQTPDSLLRAGKNTLNALAYFFSVDSKERDLAFSWQVDGENVPVADNEKQDELILEIPEGAESGSEIAISVSGQSGLNALEFASGDIVMRIK
ncbi:MAG: hypothetical protein A2939_05390 [Parcubacteria group bacterium RIFCSPLOWO2_01_FULL_48_18]|nr:MAG: hypothetical protein A3J67_06580 [Parcubacteria group bacterium RIFCSPHIGHO2_02_FULL_48_10b]OHB22531.1 MAG: hypothetical protein A2939_05390 [Parcubacteria group bacterium RIFCSPLOWO2_01_FULL_48_18]